MDGRRVLSAAIAFATLFTASFSFAAPQTKDEEIRIRVDSLKGELSLTGQSVRYSGLRGTLMGYRALRVQWQRADAGFYVWTIKDRDSDALLTKVKARRLQVMGESLMANLKRVPNQLSLTPNRLGRIDLIATMDVEDYIRGVLPSEMPKSWPLEALKAQAVAARTYALYRKMTREKMRAPYHLETTVMDQVFETPLYDKRDASFARVDQAIRETRGVYMVMPGARPHPMAAFFHADCGGQTEKAANVWGSGENSGTTQDASCPLNPLANWKLSLSLNEVNKKLRSQLKRGQLAELNSLTPFSFTDSGRVHQLQALWNDGSRDLISAQDFRMLLGHERIKSTNFKIARGSQGEFELEGQGFGHGVGMCQWGARHLAEKGKGFQLILKHYYPKAVVSERDTRVASADTSIKR